MSRIWKIGIIGAGQVVENMHLPVLKAMHNVDIVWLCDINYSKACSVAKKYGISQVYGNLTDTEYVDIMLVAIPVGCRQEILNLAFEKQSHLFIEKPFARTKDEHEMIINKACKSGIKVVVGLLRRFYHCTILLSNIVKSRVFGNVLEVRAAEVLKLRGVGRSPDWYLFKSSLGGGGVLIERGAHIIDQVFQILSVTDYKNLKSDLKIYNDIDIDTIINANLITNDNQLVPFSLHLSMIDDLHEGIAIHYDKCTLFIDTSPNSKVIMCNTGQYSDTWYIDSNIITAKDWRQAIFLEWESFFKYIELNISPLIDPTTALLTTRFIEEAYKTFNMSL